MDREVINITNEVAKKVGRDILTNFDSAVVTAKEHSKKVDEALRYIGRTNGIRNNDLKEIALKIQTAKIAEWKGEQLTPLLEDVFPAVAAKTLEPPAPAGSDT